MLRTDTWYRKKSRQCFGYWRFFFINKTSFWFLKRPRDTNHSTNKVGICWNAPWPLQNRLFLGVQRGGISPPKPETPLPVGWAGRSSSLWSSCTFSCGPFHSCFWLIFPTLIRAHIPRTENEGGWPKAPCTSLTSTLSQGNYANYHTRAQDWKATSSAPVARRWWMLPI